MRRYRAQTKLIDAQLVEALTRAFSSARVAADPEFTASARAGVILNAPPVSRGARPPT
jgi:hypothetical protein